MASAAPINFQLSSDEVTKLGSLAISAKRKAYCPYSNFRVGASILVEDGSYVQGSNVEIASTPNGVCAERCAFATLVASYERPVMPRCRALAVSTDIYPPASCCGSCRQVVREFCEADMPVYMYGRPTDRGQQYAKDISADDELKLCGKPVVMTIGELLPMSFGPNDMDKREKKTPANIL